MYQPHAGMGGACECQDVSLRGNNASVKRLRPVVPHPVYPGVAVVHLTRRYFAVISAVDADAVGRFNWHTTFGAKTRYGFDLIAGMSLHRFVARLMGLALNAEVDHENGNGLDCRRSNLRDATHAQNQQNRVRLRQDNVSGVTGVAWDAGHCMWRARISVDGKRLHIGRFDTLGQAAAAVEAERRVRHGQFAGIV